jgi:hypothetical protein
MRNAPLGQRGRNDQLHYEQRCTICQRCGVYTEFHHIITPQQAPEHSSNANNMVELCLLCHNRTTASLVYRKLNNIADNKCYRCGREGHFDDACYAMTDVRGTLLATTVQPVQPRVQPNMEPVNQNGFLSFLQTMVP